MVASWRNLKEKIILRWRFLTLYFSLLEEFCGSCDVLNFDQSWVPLLMNVISQIVKHVT